MTPEELRGLKPGDRVRWREDGACGVIETGGRAFFCIRWDRGSLTYHYPDEPAEMRRFVALVDMADPLTPSPQGD